WHTDDAGASWRRGVKGLPRWPEDAQEDAAVQCVHNMHRAPAEPDTMYLQFHGGVYRSDDAGDTWQSIAEGLPSDFGLPLVVDPGAPNRPFVIPLASDLDHLTPERTAPVAHPRPPAA